MYVIISRINMTIFFLVTTIYFIYILSTIMKAYIKDDYPYVLPKFIDKYINWGEAANPGDLLCVSIVAAFICAVVLFIGILLCMFWPVLWIYLLLLYMRYKNRVYKIYSEENKTEY